MFTNSTGNETGIVVNGVLALVHGSVFVANHVPLQEGANTITAIATDSTGYTAKDSVTADAEIIGNYITVTADTESGIAILETTLTIDTPFTPTDIDIVKMAGPEPLEYLPGSEPNEIIIRMDQVGLYYFLAIAEDDQSNSYTDTIAILVIDEAVLDALLKAKWDAMKTALINGDIDGALLYFHESSKEEYQEVFNFLINEIPGIASEMREIDIIYSEDEVTKYRIKREETVQEQTYDITYYIYFVKGLEGLWKIDSY